MPRVVPYRDAADRAAKIAAAAAIGESMAFSDATTLTFMTDSERDPGRTARDTAQATARAVRLDTLTTMGDLADALNPARR